ncbi:MAG: adenylate/guanylate cyclase domain-containing protein [Candidatus Limnocylindria bacterium]
MTSYTRAEIATRSGVSAAQIERLVELGVLQPTNSHFTAGDARRASTAHMLELAGIPLEVLSAALADGSFSLAFLDHEMYSRLPTYVGRTFAQVSAGTGIPLALLVALREAIGSPTPSPDDPMREDEMEVVPFIELQVTAGFDPAAIERLLRVEGDSLRRIAEVEADWYGSQVSHPSMERGEDLTAVGTGELSTRLETEGTRALMAILRAHQGRAWGATILDEAEFTMSRAGLHDPQERHPAMCFLDITGYTRLTQERGDAAAAELAERLSRLVIRSSLNHGGKAVKWLGDGVMFHFPDPGLGVAAALQMVAGVAEAGLPPAHVGLHAGSVVFQEGDYFGQTVNVASRLAEYARPGEVVVSQAVVNATVEPAALGVAFVEIGPVELKGVSGVMHLYVARPAAPA